MKYNLDQSETESVNYLARASYILLTEKQEPSGVLCGTFRDINPSDDPLSDMGGCIGSHRDNGQSSGESSDAAGSTYRTNSSDP